MASSAPRRAVAVAATLILLAQPAKPQTCTDVCDGTCGSTCCDLFATMNTACSQEVDAHVLTPWAPCSETCLDSLEAILRVTAGSSCEPIWERTLTDLADYRTESFPNGQHALYEEFLEKCQDQRRDQHMSEHLSQNPVYFTALDDYMIDAEAPVIINSKHTDASVGIGMVDPDPDRKVDVRGETTADSVEVWSLNGWNSTKLKQAKNLATYLCGCDMDTVWYEAERGRRVNPWLLDCGCDVGGTDYCTRDGTCECKKDEQGEYTREGAQCERWITSGLHIGVGR